MGLKKSKEKHHQRNIEANDNNATEAEPNGFVQLVIARVPCFSCLFFFRTSGVIFHGLLFIKEICQTRCLFFNDALKFGLYRGLTRVILHI